MSEEAINLLGSCDNLREHLDSHTSTIVANYNKKFVVYITDFSRAKMNHMVRNFYPARNQAKGYQYKEKDTLAWVSWSSLKNAIANVQRDAQGHLLPVRLWANVIQPNGKLQSEQIIIRPVLVSCLKSYCADKPSIAETGCKIRYYKW